jgi:Domain of unknown function (DUF4384)
MCRGQLPDDARLTRRLACLFQVSTCARLARRLEYVQETLQKLQVRARRIDKSIWAARVAADKMCSPSPTQRSGDVDKCSQAKLKPLTLLLEDVKKCAEEFKKVRRPINKASAQLRLTLRPRQLSGASKFKRAMRAAEFKEKFEKYDTELTRIQTDLLLREVSGLSDAQAEVFKVQLSAAEAHRRDLEAMMEELRAENARLIQEVEATGSKEIQVAMGKLRSESKSALDALASQAAEQKKMLEAMSAKGAQDLGDLSTKMDRIAANAASSAAAAAAATMSATAATAATERLAIQHAEATAELKELLKASGAAASADAKRLQDGMHESQVKLKAAVNNCNVQLKEALRDAQKSLSAEGKAAAKEILENVEAVQVMTEAQLHLLGDVAKEVAEIKTTLNKVVDTTGHIDANVVTLLKQMQELRLAKDTPPPDPQARKDALLAALSKIRSSAASVDVAMQGVYNADPGEAVQSALKSVQRAVQLVGILALSLEEKTKMLQPALTPRLTVKTVEGALETCTGVSKHTPAEVIADKRAPLRAALDQLVAANEEGNAALSGAGSHAAAKVPPGWARDLWTYAFTAFAYSGSMSTLMSAKNSGYPGTCDDARLAQFAMQKQQDAALGAGNTVDVYEWAAMALAAGDPISTALEVSTTNSSGLEAQRLLDRFISFANANKADDSFKIFVDLVPPAGSVGNTGPYFTMTGQPVPYPVRGLGTERLVSSSTYEAFIGDLVKLEVTATQDCYFYLVEQDSGGGICPLIPWNENVKNVDNRLIANVTRPVPMGNDGFQIRFKRPAGLERVLVFGVKQPIIDWGNFASIENDTRRSGFIMRGMASEAVKPGVSVATYELKFQLNERSNANR